jgi:hypothetical protein
VSELPGTTSVGIESVEWLDGGAGNLTVRITGRWRRRRGLVGADSVPPRPTMLVIEIDGRHHRFPATPEPVSVSGPSPGMWRLSFSVPATIAPQLGHTWLAFGSVTVPLPTPGTGAPAPEAPAPPPGAAAAGQPPAPDPERTLAIERAWRRAEDAESRAQDAESRVGDADRSRRAAEQRAHAEEAMRRDLARQLAENARETARVRHAMGDLAAAEDRIRRLETDLEAARRTGDEAGQLVAAAQVARERAERSLREHQHAQRARVSVPAEGVAAARMREQARLAFEEGLRARRAGTEPRVPTEPTPGSWATVIPAVTALTPTPSARRPAPDGVGELDLVTALRGELNARARDQAALRARTVAAEGRLAARVLLEQRTTQTLRELRAELDRVRVATQAERERRIAAEAEVRRLRAELGGERERSQDASTAIGELRGALEALRPRPVAPAAAAPAGDPGDPGAAPTGGSGPIDPDALSAALSRLRATAPVREEEGVEGEPPVTDVPAVQMAVALRAPAAIGGSTVERAFRRLASADPEAAGRLLLGLLPCQYAAYPHPIAYDLVLGPGRGCVQVTAGGVGPGSAQVTLQGAARAREQVDFQVVGDPAALARLLTASGLRRMLRFGIARVRGRRDGLAALRALLGLPLDLAALRGAGLHADGEAILRLVAAMIEPAWTRGEAFTIAYAPAVGDDTERIYLTVGDGRPPVVSRALPGGRVATTVSGAPSALAALLSAPGAPGATVSGDRGPLDQLRAWVNRARG